MYTDTAPSPRFVLVGELAALAILALSLLGLVAGAARFIDEPPTSAVVVEDR